MLKALHINKGILTGKECTDCASKLLEWYELTAIVISTKSPCVVQQSLDVLQKQSVRDCYESKELSRLLKGRPTLQLSIRNRNAHGTDTEVGACSDLVSS